MVTPKRRGETPVQRHKREHEERALAKRIEQTKPTARSPWWYVACRDLADEFGLDHNDTLDQADERAAIREYDGGMTRAEAERAAIEDVRARYAQPRLAL